jgi:preprotein translocase subunit SecF
MKTFKRRTIAVIVFLVGAFVSGTTQGHLYGDISKILMFLIMSSSFSLMFIAISLWRQKDEMKGCKKVNPASIEK